MGPSDAPKFQNDVKKHCLPREVFLFTNVDSIDVIRTFHPQLFQALPRSKEPILWVRPGTLGGDYQDIVRSASSVQCYCKSLPFFYCLTFEKGRLLYIHPVGRLVDVTINFFHISSHKSPIY